MSDHKSLFPPTDMEIIGFIVLFLCSIITTVAGIGGGVIFLPILMLMFDFNDKDAVPISISIVFIILFLRNILSIPERHPRRDKPIINYDIALIFSPSIIMGTIFGVLINQISATWLILLFIIIIMSFNGIITTKNAILKMRNEEQLLMNSENKVYLNKVAEEYIQNIKGYLSHDIISLSPTKFDPSEDLVPIETETIISYQIKIQSCPKGSLEQTLNKLQMYIDNDKKIVDYKKISLMLLNLLVLIILNLLKGNKNSKSIVNVEFCSALYWVLEFIYIPFGLAFLFFVIKLLIYENKEKTNVGYVFLKNDIKWDFKTCLKITLNGILVGVVSSMLGIGGAIISAPLLLELKVETQEASFTASFMAFFSSTATVIQYLISGKIRWDYAGFCGIFTAIGMLIGLLGIVKYLKRKNLLYIITFCLVAMIITATALNIFSDISEMINNSDDSLHFHSVC